MHCRLETKPAFNLIGFELRTNCNEGRNLREIPEFWQKYLAGGWNSRIPNRVHPMVELGICADFDPETGDFSYIIGMEAEHFEGVQEDLVCRTIPEATYAIFTTPLVPHEEFTGSIQAAWKSIFEEWFPHSGYEHAGAAEFELYDERCHMDKCDKAQMDIYIPVRPAANA